MTFHFYGLVTLPETNIAPENRPLEVWRFLLETTIFRGYVSFREGNKNSHNYWLTAIPMETGRFHPLYNLNQNRFFLLITAHLESPIPLAPHFQVNHVKLWEGISRLSYNTQSKKQRREEMGSCHDVPIREVCINTSHSDRSFILLMEEIRLVYPIIERFYTSQVIDLGISESSTVVIPTAFLEVTSPPVGGFQLGFIHIFVNSLVASTSTKGTTHQSSSTVPLTNIPLIYHLYIANWVIMCYLPLIKGTRKLH